MRPRLTLEAQLALVVSAAVLTTLALVALAQWTWGSWALTLPLAAALAFPLGIWIARSWARPLTRTLQALDDGLSSLKDGDFSISIASDRGDELGALVRHYDAVGDVLRRERQDLFQRELLLDTVIQASPLALVLTDARDRVIYSNTVARQMFDEGRRLEGAAFDALIAQTPTALQEAVAAGRDTLFSLDGADGEPEVFHLAQRRFVLNGREHRLHLFKRLTRELTRQEVATWKKVIRIISHELNNSLAPISSLAHSGALIAKDPDPARLANIFATIEERATHLKGFLEGYARFAKLPAPRIESVEWRPFLDSLSQLIPVRIVEPLPTQPGRFDPAQVQQLLINLLKNAHESGSAPAAVALSVADDGRTLRLQVLDAGSGMPEAVLKNALLPFYSTKRSGAGLGLTLCREIAEAHGGRLAFTNLPQGGLAVSLWLPHAAAL